MNGFITTLEAAEILNVSVRRVQALIAAGRLPKTRKVGEGNRATYYVWPADLELIKDRKPGRPWPKKAPAKDKPVKKKEGRKNAK